MELRPEDWSSRQRLVYVLDSWQLIFAVSLVRTGGSGDGVPELPEMTRHPTVVELERLLRELAREEPVDHAHLAAFRTGAEWRLGWELEPRTLISGRKHLVMVRRRQRLVPRWVDLARVDDGESWLEREFEGEVNIPTPLWYALTR